MCMITYVPANVALPVRGITNGGISNDDGHGFAIASANHGLEVFKSMKFDETLAQLLDARDRHGLNSVVLFHSRWATHGEYGEYNIHPFPVGVDTVMAHNGILPSLYIPGMKERKSDTRLFADAAVREGVCDNPNGVPSRRIGRQIGKHIGSGNKLVFLSVLSGQPKVRIINSHLGTHDGGVWYSNSGYCERRSYTYGGSMWGGGHYYDKVKVGGLGREPLDECPVCGSVYGVSFDYAWCYDCDYCLDCIEQGAACTCYGSSSSSSPLVEGMWSEDEWREAGYVSVDGQWVHWSTVDEAVLARIDAAEAAADRERVADEAAAYNAEMERLERESKPYKVVRPAVESGKSKALVPVDSPKFSASR